MSKKKISGKLEDYLEAVWVLQERGGHAHVQDIADAVGVHKSTVSSALHSLADENMVNYEPYRAATLTDEGLAKATEIDRKHRLFRKFMTTVLMVDLKTADENACRMEHAMDTHVARRLADFMDFVEQADPASLKWLEDFKEFVVDNNK